MPNSTVKSLKSITLCFFKRFYLSLSEARYTHRIAISNSRITSITADAVTFKYRDYKDSKEKLCTLSHLEFTRRFLQHVPPPGFVRIRYYGFLAHAKKNKLLPKIKEALLTKLTVSTPTKTLESKPETKLSACCLAPLIIKILSQKELQTITAWNTT